MDAIQEKRLIELADFLEVIPLENFHMPDWHGHAHEIGVGRKHGESTFETPVQAMECGTACCVAGWAAVLNSDEWLAQFGSESVSLDDDNDDVEVLRVDESSFADFFGITYEASERLCTSFMHYTAPEKAEQIREVVENDGAVPEYTGDDQGF